jgi:hypothetical protein
MPERRIVKGSIAASILLEIGEVVEEQTLFDLDTVSDPSCSDSPTGQSRAVILKASPPAGRCL